MNLIKKIPILLLVVIYMPASFLGLLIFRDIYSVSLLAMFFSFIAIYLAFFKKFASCFVSSKIRKKLFDVGDKINWRLLAFLSLVFYCFIILYASLTVNFTPIGAAFSGGDWLDIATARANFLINRSDESDLLRYLVVIFSRTIIPIIMLYTYDEKHKARHFIFLLISCCYLISLEKVLLVFLFAPLMILNASKGLFRNAALQGIFLFSLLVIVTYISQGGFYRPFSEVSSQLKPTVLVKPKTLLPEKFLRYGIPERFDFRELLAVSEAKISPPTISPPTISPRGKIPCASNIIICKSVFVINRIFWIPYITAYDWLKVKDDVFQGRLNYGRAIHPIAWIYNEPFLDIERIVYQYEFGIASGGAGGSNAIFLVDANLAFGWLGVLGYSLLVTFFAAIIFSSRLHILHYASFVTFLTLNLSSFSATLFSGGLFIFIFLALLVRGPSKYLPPKYNLKK